ncbi:hypothetical protein [Pseudonocardia sp.]|uniref:hypothetical protein n=1 Tax=Pseudonocardia sp. TaxID=60912 RepID=UPI0025FB5F35|nr:hypothetical protein [Pseudonocardia sp.]
MGPVPGVLRSLGAAPVVALAVALLGGCGGSVADADTARPAPTTRPVSPQAAPFCAAVQANADAIRPLNGLSLSGPLNAAGDGLTAAVTRARLSGVALVNAAPDQLRDDVQRVVNALDVELNALVAAGGDAARAARDPAVTAANSTPEVIGAGQRVSTYVQQNCQAGSR